MASRQERESWGRALDAVRDGADPEAVARELVGQLTDDEKLDLLDGAMPFWAGLTDLGRGGYHRRPFPAAQVPRLGIPGFSFSDGPRGAVIGPATAFPAAILRGASFDPDVELAVADAIGSEIRAVGATLFGGICVNLLRHLAWGRAQETYGEDPHLLGVMAEAAVAGVQRHVMATVKHFACNSMEVARFKVDVEVDLATLLEVYTPHFRRAIDAGVACVMSAYNAVNGEFCGESHLLLDYVLRRRFGFRGFVISDWIFGLRDGVQSLRAGLDVEMPYRMVRHEPIRAALASGELSWELVERANARVLSTILRFGLAPSVGSPRDLATGAHRALAREVATRGFVLLKNDLRGGRLLPVAPTTSVAVFGRLATMPNLGDGGSSDVYAPDVVTLAAGIQGRFPHTTVDAGHDLATAATVAAAHDLAVVVVGSTRDDEGEFIGDVPEPLRLLMPGPDDPAMVERFDAYREAVDWPSQPGYGDRAMGADVGGDRRQLTLRAEDEALVRAVAAANPACMVVVMGATGAVLGDLVDDVAAVLFVFYPGLEGGRALADVLCGASEPAGRLPFALPRSERDLVAFDRDAERVDYSSPHGQWHLDAASVDAAFPFGFGLGWGPVAVTAANVADGVATATVHNPHDHETNSCVVVHARHVDHHRTWRLVGFARGLVPPRASVRIPVALHVANLGRYEPAVDDLVVPEGRYEIEIGRYARDPDAVHVEVDVAAFHS